MHRLVTLLVSAALLASSTAAAGPILDSAERLAIEAALQGDVSDDPSLAKRVTSIALIAAGIGAVLAGNPEFVPSQFIPGNYPNRVNISAYLGAGRYPGHTYELLRRRGADYGYRWVCRNDAATCVTFNDHLNENYRVGYTDGHDDGLFLGRVQGHRQGWREGHAAGQADVIRIIDANGLVVYDGEFDPASYVRETFSDRKGMRYGGVGLIAVGAILNLVWPDNPARLSAGPLRGGGEVGVTFGF